MTLAFPRLPSLDDVLEGAVPFRVALNVNFRGVTERTGLLLSGPAGWGEFAPFADYDDVGAAAWLAAAVEAAWLGWPEPVRDVVAVNGIIPDVPVNECVAIARAAVDRGVRTLKLKVAGAQRSAVDDLVRLQAVRDAVGDGVRLRIDANGGWSVEQALEILEAIGGLSLEYVEQPCATLDECAVVKASEIAPVAVDEGLRRAAAVEDARLHDKIRASGDIVILKSAPLGGVRRALRIAQSLDMPTVVSGAMDTSVGLAAGVALAAALPPPHFAAGLGTGALLETDVVHEIRLPRRGMLPVGAVAPDAAELHAATAKVTDAEADELRARLARAWDAGAMQLLESVLS